MQQCNQREEIVWAPSWKSSAHSVMKMHSQVSIPSVQRLKTSNRIKRKSVGYLLFIISLLWLTLQKGSWRKESQCRVGDVLPLFPAEYHPEVWMTLCCLWDLLAVLATLLPAWRATTGSWRPCVHCTTCHEPTDQPKLLLDPRSYLTSLPDVLGSACVRLELRGAILLWTWQN